MKYEERLLLFKGKVQDALDSGRECLEDVSGHPALVSFVEEALDALSMVDEYIGKAIVGLGSVGDGEVN